MKKLLFTLRTHATVSKIWKVLWDAHTYEQWTLPFCEGSVAKTDWQVGSKVLFLSAKGEGLLSEIVANRPEEFMSFRHLGMVKNGAIDTTSEAILPWLGAMENYTLTQLEGVSVLEVTINVPETHAVYFEKNWPQALDRIQQLCEAETAAPATSNSKVIASNAAQKIVPFLWYNGQALEAAQLYTSVFANSHIVSSSPGPGGTVMSVSFVLDGQLFYGFNGGPMFTFSEAISLFVSCSTQAEIDELWERLSAGGQKSRCGWLKDQFGVSWQIVPPILGALLGSPVAGVSQRVMQAMLQMDKIDIQKLQDAAAASS